MKSATITNPVNKTFIVPKNPKILPLQLSCQMSDGKDRPYTCEVRLDKLVFIGKSGTPLATVKPSKAFPTSTPLPFDEAKSSVPAGKPGIIDNTHTVTLFPAGQLLSDSAEASIKFMISITGDPS